VEEDTERSAEGIPDEVAECGLPSRHEELGALHGQRDQEPQRSGPPRCPLRAGDEEPERNEEDDVENRVGAALRTAQYAEDQAIIGPEARARHHRKGEESDDPRACGRASNEVFQA
jgi:hypothetical protein